MKHFAQTFALLLTLIIVSSTAQAQSRSELARQYVELPAVQSMMREMFSPQSMYEQMRNTLPAGAKVSNYKKRRIGNVLSQGMMQSLPVMNKIMVSESARQFTKAELQAMIAFYSTKEGASILSKSTSFMNASMRRFAPQMEAVQKAVTPAIIKIMKD